MQHLRWRIPASHDTAWNSWPSIEQDPTGRVFRRLRSGRKQTLGFPDGDRAELLAVIYLTTPPRFNPAKNWRFAVGEAPALVHHRKSLPSYILLELPPYHKAADFVFDATSQLKTKEDLLIEEIVVMPRPGRFSELWTSLWRAAKKVIFKAEMRWAPADFPYSHFDGLGYLLAHDEVRQAILSRRYDTAFRYWHKKGRALGHRLPLAVEREPLPGTPFNLVQQVSGQKATLARQLAAASREKEKLARQVTTTSLQNIALNRQVATTIQEKSALAREIVRITAENDALRKQLSGSKNTAAAINNATKQIGASIALQHYLSTGQLTPFNAAAHSWPISADLGYVIVELLETNDYSFVVEFGSGISTLIIARTLEHLSNKTRRQSPPFFSFEHLQEYHDRTRALLTRSGALDSVELSLAPLVDYFAPNGTCYKFYSRTDEVLATVSKRVLCGQRVLAIVDGPPTSIGKHARYPAGPILGQMFPDAQVDILLDDYVRADEQEIARTWVKDFTEQGRACAEQKIQLEKDALLIMVAPPKDDTIEHEDL
jgi:hypothetical protein